jgi:hypothetical protein
MGVSIVRTNVVIAFAAVILFLLADEIRLSN